ncbi:hypothetical protein BU23DRAFT_570754 [Bimuria novae-zelandiae CBS 107.79]|uniref:Uncharacterized protein n=1 Tax=Bimuria novae-zelandiae CBS 107.79 TaxID=1447943 RepID=A0A6A5V0E3_9PLEO|nr:hypothetical protein BU23DRAFT_570754 [Bimuria novae-zelandiae CBS 107.79]
MTGSVRTRTVLAVHLGAKPPIDDSHQGSKRRETGAHEICAWFNDRIRDQIRRVPSRIRFQVNLLEADEADDGGDDTPATEKNTVEKYSHFPSLANHHMVKTRHRQNKDGDVGDDMWQTDVAITRHNISTMSFDCLIPFEFERLTYGERREDIGKGMSYAHPNNNPCDDSHDTFSKDPEIQGQDRELREQACCHVNKFGRRLYLEICCYNSWVSKKPVSDMTTGAPFRDEHCAIESHTKDVGKHRKYPDLQIVALDANVREMRNKMYTTVVTTDTVVVILKSTRLVSWASIEIAGGVDGSRGTTSKEQMKRFPEPQHGYQGPYEAYLVECM